MLLPQDGNKKAGREPFITARGCRNAARSKTRGQGMGGCGSLLLGTRGRSCHECCWGHGSEPRRHCGHLPSVSHFPREGPDQAAERRTLLRAREEGWVCVSRRWWCESLVVCRGWLPSGGDTRGDGEVRGCDVVQQARGSAQRSKRPLIRLRHLPGLPCLTRRSSGYPEAKSCDPFSRSCPTPGPGDHGPGWTLARAPSPFLLPAGEIPKAACV